MTADVRVDPELAPDRLQGPETRFANGSLIEADPHGVAHAMGLRLLTELRAMGAVFVSTDVVEACEETFYASIGLSRNEGHVPVDVDWRGS